MSATYARHHREHGHDVRISLRIARSLTALDYIQAQRVRSRMISHFGSAFTEVDAIVTPATAIVAPRIPEEALEAGVYDLSTMAQLMRFVTPANLTGLPAISFPAGYTASGLPIGMQAIGRAWEESLLLRIALNAEMCVERRFPKFHFNILQP